MISGEDMRDLDNLCSQGYDLAETGRGWYLLHGREFERGMFLCTGGIEDALAKAKDKIMKLT